ncbi:IS3 family transposase [uncultured Pseudokineococcus sp.]|uniref:IS3 family transposase n=1 Tax=uncultured Pseudokineococcus sp. TaxID=1642928 RepID=UPI002638FE62|nr:IS3 family transposase [uncultured Pseudokineococcus sp.]
MPLLLQAAGLARSTFYDHRNRLARPDRHALLKDAVGEVFAQAKGAYGHRRVHAVLLRQGWQVAKKTVLKVMHAQGLRCLVRRRRRYNSYRGEVGTTASNILDRHFAATAPNTKWVTDVSEFAIGEAKIYVSPILDLYDNRIISVAAGLSPSVKMVTDGLREAIATLAVDEVPLVHSDQGFQYRHRLWQDTLCQSGLIQSMSRKGTCLDNAVMEGFFSHLKEEWFRLAQPATVADFYVGLHQYLAWWNSTRIQARLGYLSPDEYLTLAPVAA